MAERGDLSGLGGWLILVGLGLIVSPIRLVFVLFQLGEYVAVEGAWASAGKYDPNLQVLVTVEFIVVAFLLLLSILLLVLFFMKRASFPKVYIFVSLFVIVWLVVDAAAVKMIFPDQPMFDPKTAQDLVRALLSACVWVPYMLVSKRVKATFVT